MKITTKQKISYIVGAAENKKAKDIIILDLTKMKFITDYFVVMSGSSDVQINAITDGIKDKLSKKKVFVGHLEKDKKHSWILLDYGDVIVHVFHEEVRKFYALERLWGDKQITKLKQNKKKK